MSAQVPIGIGAPNVLTIPITSPTGGPDLTTVTGASLSVLKSDGTVVSWTASVSGATTTSITVTHHFQISDCDIDGVYQVAPELTVSGGTIPCYAVPLVVTTPYRGAP